MFSRQIRIRISARKFRRHDQIVSATFCFLMAMLATPLTAQFVEPDVMVISSLFGEQATDSYGWTAENLGDINHDGANDYIISAPFYQSGGTATGKVYIYSGIDGSLLNQITGNANEWFGIAASTAGDVNADGVPDYVVGGRGAQSILGTIQGRVAVYSGSDHSVLHEWFGEFNHGFGNDVNSAGDINGDGHDDVVVGASFANFNGLRSGRVSVYSGADGSVLWTVDGDEPLAFFGSAVGRVGDLNGDGIPELTVGAMGSGLPAGHLFSGQAYVFDGASGARIYTLDPLGLGTTRRFGQFFASDAGDVDADGIPDIFVADYADGHGGKGAGSAYVFSGADGSYIHILHGEKGDGFGPGRGIGDINADGFDDLIVAAYTHSEGAPFAGKTYIISGLDGQIVEAFTGNIANELQGVDAVGLGDVNSDGHPDYLITGSGSAYVVSRQGS